MRLRFEEEVLGPLDVTTKHVFGRPGYQAAGNLFAFLVTEGVVLTKLSAEAQETLQVQHATEPFGTGDPAQGGCLSPRSDRNAECGETPSTVASGEFPPHRRHRVALLVAAVVIQDLRNLSVLPNLQQEGVPDASSGVGLDFVLEARHVGGLIEPPEDEVLRPPSAQLPLSHGPRSSR